MPTNDKTKRKRPFGLSPLALLGIAALSVVIGLGGGILLDVMMHGGGNTPPRPIHPQRQVPPPLVQNLDTGDDNADKSTPSIFAPRTPEEERAAQSRAAAAPPVPEVPPAAPPTPPASTPVAAAPVVRTPPAKPPMTAYATPAPSNGSHAALAIVIDDMGLDHTRAMTVLGLPAGVTVSIMTYADDPGGLASRAHAAGHEVLAHVPMQPISAKEYPGPHTLTVAMDNDTIRSTLATDLDNWQGYVGVNNHMGSRFTMDQDRMAVVMEELKARGLLWLDSRTTQNSVGPAAAQAAGVPYVTRDIFLDNVETVAAVLEQLRQTVATAKAHGTAIAIGHPHDATIAALKQFLPTLEDQGVTLVPVTDILHRQQARTHPS